MEMPFHYPGEPGEAKIGRYTFCLSPATYGLLEVEFVRRYYNSSTKRHEMVLSVFPKAILIHPKKQSLIWDLLFGHNSSSDRSVESEVFDRIPTDQERQLASELAHAEAQSFETEEGIFIIALVVFVVVNVVALLYVVDKVGQLSKRLLLTVPPPPNHTPPQPEYPHSDVSAEHYDVFLSVSEADAETVGTDTATVINNCQQLRVFFPAHDVPPNQPELSATNAAIDNSNRFVILFSEHYRLDMLYEAETIVNCVRGRRQNVPNTVLVVKLDFSELPRWLVPCAVVDWTFIEPQEDRRPKLLWWILSGEILSQFHLWLWAFAQFLQR